MLPVALLQHQPNLHLPDHPHLITADSMVFHTSAADVPGFSGATDIYPVSTSLRKFLELHPKQQQPAIPIRAAKFHHNPPPHPNPNPLNPQNPPKTNHRKGRIHEHNKQNHSVPGRAHKFHPFRAYL